MNVVVMEQSEKGSAVRVGMQRGVFGGVVAFLVSQLGPVAGMVAAVFVGMSLGRRAAAADAGREDGLFRGLKPVWYEVRPSPLGDAA